MFLLVPVQLFHPNGLDMLVRTHLQRPDHVTHQFVDRECTFDNPRDDAQCEMCNSPRPLVRIVLVLFLLSLFLIIIIMMVSCFGSQSVAHYPCLHHNSVPYVYPNGPMNHHCLTFAFVSFSIFGRF
jgi:hypothetical protein